MESAKKPQKKSAMLRLLESCCDDLYLIAYSFARWICRRYGHVPTPGWVKIDEFTGKTVSATMCDRCGEEV